MRSSAPYLSIFVLAAALGCFLTKSATAEAFWKRRHASSCFYDSFDKDDVWNGFYYVNNNSSTSTVYLVCPVDDDNTTPKQNIVSLNIHGYDGSTSGSVEAKTCVAYWDSNGGTCASPSGSNASGTGNYALSPSLSRFTSTYAADFGYVNVILPSMDGSSRSTMRGIFISN